MKLSFVAPMRQRTVSGDVNECYRGLPRTLRKALRVASVRGKSASHDGVDEYFRTGYKTDTYHNTNLCETEYGVDEFQDIDNELDGLTVFEPLNEVELFQFCTGYDII